jgi:hypothetical protein
MSHWVISLFIALTGIAAAVLRLVGASASKRAGMRATPGKIKMPAPLALCILLLVWIGLAYFIFVLPKVASVPSNLWFIFVVNTAAIAWISIDSMRRRVIIPTSPTEEEKAGTRFGMALLVLLIVMPVLGYYHAMFGL